jgi:hypothetical protein
VEGLAAFARHVRSLWRYPWLPPLPFLVVAAHAAARHALRWEHVAIALFVIVLTCGNQATKKLLIGLYPIGLVALLYDSMKSIQNLGVTPERVHLCDLRAAELDWFGIQSAGGRITLQDYFQSHASRGLDLLCSLPYGTFIFAAIAVAIYLYFKDFAAMQRFMWAFLLLNVAGFVTYHVYPAAPPWYFHTHGCTVDLAAHASEGPNLARVDAMLGVHYFAGMYGRASDVFGAVPSLHVAYPLLIVIEAFRHFRWPLRVLSVAYFLLMCFSAVYLDHHWVIDVIVGIVYCLGLVAAIRLALRWAKTGLRRGLAEQRGDVAIQ